MLNTRTLSNTSEVCIHFAKEFLTRDELANLDSFVAFQSLKDVKNKTDLFNVVSETLGFPDYFGHNWDAMDECLTDLAEWLPSKGYILVFTDSVDAWASCSYDLGVFINCWLTANLHWKADGIPFHLVFVE